MKIVLHGFGTYPVVFRHLIEMARTSAPRLAWAVILPSPHHRDLMREVLNDEDILLLQEHQARDLGSLKDTSELANYPGNIFSDIEAEKWSFKHWPAWLQLARAAEIHRVYRTFLERVRGTHLLLPQIEGFEGRMLPGLAASLGIEPMVATFTRNLGGTFFSLDAFETLPKFKRATPATLQRARNLVARFNSEHIPSSGPPEDLDLNEELLSDFMQPMLTRVRGFLQRSLTRPDLFERENLRIGLLNNLTWLRNILWFTRARLAAREYDVARIDDLPERFIYYPLQVTPESSINTPAPYFIDQMRAIDAIRFAMPSDYTLVVKEHPANIVARPISFIKALRRKAGVTVIQYNANSRTLIQRAALTISVTGTATIEAFLLGRPSITLGPSFMSEYFGGVCPIERLDTAIRAAIGRNVDNETIVQAVAEVLSVSHKFVLRTIGTPGEPVLRRGNVLRLLEAILDHVEEGRCPVRDATA